MRGERSRKAREANERRSREEAEARRRRERAAARANTASAGGRTKTWETAQPGKKKTANDYYEEKRKKREKDRKEIDAAFNKAMEETQKMLRERDLGLIDHLDRSTGDTVYNHMAIATSSLWTTGSCAIKGYQINGDVLEQAVELTMHIRTTATGLSIMSRYGSTGQYLPSGFVGTVTQSKLFRLKNVWIIYGD